MSSVRADTLRSACVSCAAPVLPREVEVGQRPGRVEIGVGVEALHEGIRLVTQIALDLELGLGEQVANVVGELQAPPELVVERRGGEIGDVSDHAGDAHSRRRRASGAVVVAALPVRIGGDGVARDRIPGDALRVERVRARDGNDRVDLIAVLHGPLERLHAAERAAGDGGQPRDPELIQERALGPHHVRDRDDWKVGPVGPARCRVRRRRSRCAAAASQEIRADDEESVGVERLAGADHAVPPAQAAAAAAVALLGAEAVPGALRGRRRREAGGVGVSAQRVADQDDVVARRRQRPIGLVGDADRMQLASAVERKRLRKVEELRVDRADGAHGGLRRWRRHAGDHIPSWPECMISRSVSIMMP